VIAGFLFTINSSQTPKILKTYSIPHDFLVNDTVDGRIPAPALYGKYPIIYKVLYIPGGCLGFLSINSSDSST